ncbi:MAG: large subunit ribosomal protein L22 [Candidatus Deianiraeaceae bacterium]|jgi:large subunit ribosomal protein L22
MTTATLKKAPISHRKLSLACDMVRGGIGVSQATTLLMFQVQKSCQILYRVLLSAIANAENNHNIDPDSLIIDRIEVGPATRLKRFDTRGRGRSAPIRKHYSNITVILKSQTN